MHFNPPAKWKKLPERWSHSINPGHRITQWWSGLTGESWLNGRPINPQLEENTTALLNDLINLELSFHLKIVLIHHNQYLTHRWRDCFSTYGIFKFSVVSWRQRFNDNSKQGDIFVTDGKDLLHLSSYVSLVIKTTLKTHWNLQDHSRVLRVMAPFNTTPLYFTLLTPSLSISQYFTFSNVFLQLLRELPALQLKETQANAVILFVRR